ncbi:MAG: tRNA (adenosine(37)-N6)-dimethylallyltransferase MiaA [Bryobacteraceae bacterium]
MITPQSPLIVVVGPTGSGKSELGIHLAGELNGEIVGCDSVQVYSGVDIGSAKVLPEQREAIPHHLLDIAAPSAKVTAGEYSRLARRAIAGITARARLPIVVGGTGLYLRALLEGLSPAPKRDEHFRTRLEQVVARRPEILVRYLRRFDRESAGRIHPNDGQKMTRAVELCHISGQPASAVHDLSRDALVGFRTLKLGLNPERALLYEKLNGRTEWMFANGLLEETRTLMEACGNSATEVLRSLGYSQATRYLRGELALEDAIAQCQIKTRNYAKRQMTWFRSDPNIYWIHEFGSGDKAKSVALKTIRAFLRITRKSE